MDCPCKFCDDLISKKDRLIADRRKADLYKTQVDDEKKNLHKRWLPSYYNLSGVLSEFSSCVSLAKLFLNKCFVK